MLPSLAAISSVLIVAALYRASLEIRPKLAPQGCRMSWMSPSYLLQRGFNSSWTPLANRYSLFLYREVGWDASDTPQGLPVLFIPGNAGSSHQVRSIASSAARQYYDQPYHPAPEFASSAPLDFFAVEFNEDLSAFHGATLDSQHDYTAAAIDYILTFYPPMTPILVLGHSMGGIVAVSLLPESGSRISAVITMSTPHALPPARFERRIERIYDKHAGLLLHDPTPILSLCGGATDAMVASETCVLPATTKGPYRRTVFTSALEGTWTGVGHREMVWCHQVRWRVARAALELAHVRDTPNLDSTRRAVLDRWFRDGSNGAPTPIDPYPSAELDLESSGYPVVILKENVPLLVRQPRGEITYLLPIPLSVGIEERRFVLYLSGGAIPPISAHNSIPLQASVAQCHETTSRKPSCSLLSPSILKLLPYVNPSKSFPVPDEGSDESEGTILFEAVLRPGSIAGDWIGITLKNGDGRGWAMGGFETRNGVHSAAVAVPFYSTISAPVDPTALRTQISFPHLLSDTLLVYRLTAESTSACSGPLLPPLLVRSTLSPYESSYYPLVHPLHDAVYLHAHGTGPFIPSLPAATRGVNLTIYSSGEPTCGVTRVYITVDYWTSLGRLAMRYWPAIVTWCTGVCGWIIATGMRANVLRDRPMTTVYTSLSIFIRQDLPKLCIGVFVMSLLPLPAGFILGNRGEVLFAPLAPLILLVSTGLVCVSWLLLTLLLWPVQKLFARSRPSEEPLAALRVSKGDGITLLVVGALIAFLVPWQVVFIGCWLVHIYSCATSLPAAPSRSAIELQTPDATAASNPLLKEGQSTNLSPDPSGTEDSSLRARSNVYQLNTHFLLLLTWILPLVAPILAVWVRTLATAGLTAPSGEDRNFMNALPVYVLTDLSSRSGGLVGLFRRNRSSETVGVRWYIWAMFGLLPYCVLVGARRMFNVLDSVNFVLCLMFFALVRSRPSQ